MENLLDKAREEINEADRAIAAAFERRMTAVRSVAQYKRNTGKPIFDPAREAQVIERGGVILCSVGPGTFTDSGHFILLCGYAQGEGFLVHDPNSAVRSGRYYRFADLADEIVQLWFAYR